MAPTQHPAIIIHNKNPMIIFSFVDLLLVVFSGADSKEAGNDLVIFQLLFIQVELGSGGLGGEK